MLPRDTIPRTAWSPAPRNRTPQGQRPDELVGVEVHHSVGLYGNHGPGAWARAMQLDHLARGWADVWYALGIWLDGTPIELRGAGYYSSPARGLLTVCFAGNYDHRQPSGDQLATLDAIRAGLAAAGGGLAVRRHNQRAAVSCPGANLTTPLAAAHLTDPMEDTVTPQQADRIEAKLDTILDRLGDRNHADDHKRLRDSLAALGAAQGVNVNPSSGHPRVDITA